MKELISLGATIVKTKQSFEIDEYTTLPQDLHLFLLRSNGLFAFESALMIRPLITEGDIYSIIEWNDSKLWKSSYSDNLVLNTLFFAEDAFGCQFGFYENQIYFFDPETGEIEFMCKSFDEWCDLIVSEYKQYTGYQLMCEWQMANAPITLGHRLCPKLPFVLGGQYEVDNLYSINALQGMLLRSSIATQIRDLPDGSEIQLRIK